MRQLSRKRLWLVVMSGVVLACIIALIVVRRTGSTNTRLAVLQTAAVGQYATAAELDGRGEHLLVLLAPPAPAQGSLLILEPATAVVRHTIPLHDQVSALAVDSRTGHAFITGSKSISMLDTSSGDILYTVPLSFAGSAETGYASSMAIDETRGRVFVATDSGVGVLDTGSGRLRRMIVTPEVVESMVADPRTGHLIVSGVTPGGKGDAMAVSVLDAIGGKVLRTVCKGTNRGRPVVDGLRERAFVFTSDITPLSNGTTTYGNVMCMIDMRDGALLRTAPLNGIPNAAAVDDRTGRVFVTAVDVALTSGGGSKGYLYALDGQSGKLDFTAQVGVGPGYIAVDRSRGRLLVLSFGPPPGGPGTVSMLDEQGKVMGGSVAADVAPLSVPVDEHTGRVFVLNGGGITSYTSNTVAPSRLIVLDDTH